MIYSFHLWICYWLNHSIVLVNLNIIAEWLAFIPISIFVYFIPISIFCPSIFLDAAAAGALFMLDDENAVAKQSKTEFNLSKIAIELQMKWSIKSIKCFTNAHNFLHCPSLPNLWPCSCAMEIDCWEKTGEIAPIWMVALLTDGRWKAIHFNIRLYDFLAPTLGQRINYIWS